MKTDKEILFSYDCGDKERTCLFKDGSWYIGCFVGTQEQAESAIRYKYSATDAKNYIDKIRNPQPFDKQLYNWGLSSETIAEFCPEHFDKELYNWEYYSWAIVKYCPEHFDKELYNWEYYSWAIAKYCPELLEYKPK